MVLESGLAGPIQSWFAVAKLLDDDFAVVIHRRAKGVADLETLAHQLHDALCNPPYLLAAHSFGGLVARQFAALYPAETAGILLVDALPVTANIEIGKAIAIARICQLLAAAVPMLLPLSAKHFRHADWVMQELDKLPEREQILKEWASPSFYASVATLLAALPRSLKRARALQLPAGVPILSLYSDYHDPEGRRVEDAGHWIQVDQPAAVADAIRELGCKPWDNTAKGV